MARDLRKTGFKDVRILKGGLGAWTNARDLPSPPTETFRQWWVREHGNEDA